MLIERIGPDGETRTRDLNITEEQLKLWEENTTPDEEVFPELSEEDLVFFQTGLTTAEIEILKAQQLTRRSKYLPAGDL